MSGRERGRKEGEEWRKTVESIESFLKRPHLVSVFQKNPLLRVRMIRRLDSVAKKEKVDAEVLKSVKRFVNEFCRVMFGEHLFRDELARELHGKIEVRLASGRADVATATHVYEVEYVKRWRQGIEQAMRYGKASGLKPVVVLFGQTPSAMDMLRIRLEAARLCIDLLLKLWE